ncbi:c-type cytochrome domain-containing protein [Roseovarius nanhaiticus]|uniref:c-type cytochrome domain-containing protein n=1 Tax=Roseovarius nanhaiticus TaxID=573024 RepID=UPI0024911BE8|nr:c-type cytochrome domain-containing protein [Roseovarius nanhaiticus]
MATDFSLPDRDYAKLKTSTNLTAVVVAMHRKHIAIAFAASVALFPYRAAGEDWATVQALFQERCVACHSGEFAPLGLRLDSYSNVINGSENGPVMLVDAVEKSRLVQRITGLAEPRMPLDGPPFLTDDQVNQVTAWIASGAAGSDLNSPGATEAEPHDPFADGRVTYDEVSAIFGRHCIECHSDNSRYDLPPEGLRLDRYQSVLAGGDRLVLIPGNAQASEIIRRVEGLASPRMPFDGPPWLAPEEVALLRNWIDGGALSPDGIAAPVPVNGRVRMRGILTSPTEIDGAEFTITESTRVDDQPRVGRAAEMRGRVDAIGRIVADRLRDR